MLQVNHKNKIRTDNSIDNLEILTPSEHRNLDGKPVCEIGADGKRVVGQSWITVSCAGEKTGLHGTNISAVCNGVIKHVRGRTFAYISSLADIDEQKKAMEEAKLVAEELEKDYAMIRKLKRLNRD
jgi:hypothetical protein